MSDWTLLFPATSPPPRLEMAMCLDENRSVVVLFGGHNSSAFDMDDTWEWDGADWTEIFPVDHPSGALSGGASNGCMVFDAANGVCVFFAPRSGETWTYDGTNWTQHFPAHSPTARYEYAMAYDANNGVTVLFGGYSTSGFSALFDTWTWDGTDWTQLFPATAPAVTGFAAWDDANGNVVMFGTRRLGANSDATYIWDGTDWTLVSPTSAPSPRKDSRLVYDNGCAQVVLFGGFSSVLGVVTVFTDTWGWDGSDWTNLSPIGFPAGGDAPGLAESPDGASAVLFGGASDPTSTLDETWVFQCDVPPSSDAHPYLHAVFSTV